MAIPIRNLYYMFCYAWRKLPEAPDADVGVDDCPDVLNLFARLLASGSSKLLRRGLDRGYRSFDEETRAPRGKVLMDAMIKQQTWTRSAAICTYDELTADVLHNQILKATSAKLCLTDGVAKEIRLQLATLVKQLGGVSDLRLTASSFRRVQLSRNTRQYGPLMRMCELLHNHLMPSSGGTGFRFADILSDEVVMSKVFEEFLRSFLTLEQDDFEVRSEIMSWEGRAEREQDWSYVPAMLTDITLRSASQTIVIDAKFYNEPFESRWSAPKIRPSHLYQLMAYVRRAAVDARKRQVGGVLIYPAHGEGISLRYQLGGHAIGVEVFDFSQPWQIVHERLLKLLADQRSGMERVASAHALG